MLLVGLTGGIGSGKSTVGRMLADLGAVVFDADTFARAAIEPGTPGYAKVVGAFPEVIDAGDGSIDRAQLARRVFKDEAARRELEAIVHPEVARLSQAEIGRYADTDRVVVYVMPLLVEKHAEPTFDVVVVISGEESLRIARLVSDRNISEEDARDRLAAQATDEERGAVADFVIDNDEGLGELQTQVDTLWATLRARAAGE